MSAEYWALQAGNLRQERDEARADAEQLRAALRPFADYAERIDTGWDSKGIPGTCPAGLKLDIDGSKEIVHLSDFRRAREVLGA